ncbi:MAG: F0F1 ATP synthase subunit B' [Xanthobacteraceae bacterium]
MATAAHTEAPGGGHKGPFPPFQKETFASQLVWFAVFFVALYLIMSRLALPRIGTILAQRRQRIEDDLKAAQRLREDSDAELAAYEKALADARGRAQTIANETREKLNAEAERTRKVLEGELNAKLEEAEKIISATKQAALVNVRGIAIDAAAAIVERLIGSEPAGKAVETAVDSVLKR